MEREITMEDCRRKFGSMTRFLRGSEILTREIRSAAVTYKRVVELLPEGRSKLDCGHVADASERNPTEMGQVRYCSGCTDEKLALTGDL